MHDQNCLWVDVVAPGLLNGALPLYWDRDWGNKKLGWLAKLLIRLAPFVSHLDSSARRSCERNAGHFLFRTEDRDPTPAPSRILFAKGDGPRFASMDIGAMRK